MKEYNAVAGIAYDSSGLCKIGIGNVEAQELAWLILKPEMLSDLYNLIGRWLSDYGGTWDRVKKK